MYAIVTNVRVENPDEARRRPEKPLFLARRASCAVTGWSRSMESERLKPRNMQTKLRNIRCPQCQALPNSI
jgi:hypothetical protein